MKSPCLHLVFGPPCHPHPLFQWNLQSKEILLYLSISCTRFETKYSSCTVRKFYYISAFHAQGSRPSIVVVQLGVVKIYVTTVEAIRKKETQDENSIYHQDLVEKLVCVSVISFCKIFIPNYVFDPLLCRNWPSSSTNCKTLQITLMYPITWCCLASVI